MAERDDRKPAAAPNAVAAPPAHGRGGHRVRVDLTTGSIPKKLFGQAWPQVIESVLGVADEFVDLFWAGRLPGGFRSIASVGVAQTITGFAGRARSGLDVAVRAMIARAVGARDIQLANHILFQGLFLTALYSIGMVAIGFLLTDLFLRLLGASAELQAEAAWYMRIQFAGSATQSFRNLTGVALQAAGEPIIPMRATLVSRLFHVVLAPFLMFGWWIFPEMGLAGSALATVLAQLVGIAINVYGLASGQSRLTLDLRHPRLDFPLMWRQIKTATPASVRGVERGLSQVVLLGFVAPFGDVTLAAYSLTRRLEQLTSFGSGGMAQASGVMVGQNLGAGNPARAKEAVLWALLFTGVLKVILTVFFFFFATASAMVFTGDAATVDLTAQWVRIQVFSTVLMGLTIVLQESFNGAGDTLGPMVLTLLGVWLVEVPVAWYLCTQTSVGPLGVAWALIACFAARLAFSVPYYFWGRWLRVKVI